MFGPKGKGASHRAPPKYATVLVITSTNDELFNIVNINDFE